jgi:hypothetical protein
MMVRLWTMYHVIVFTLLSLSLYFGWIFFQDTVYGYANISYTQAMVWSSPQFYLVQLLNAGWLLCFEVGVILVGKEKSLYNNIGLLNKVLKMSDCKLDVKKIGNALMKER